MQTHVHFSSASNEWETPIAFFEQLDDEFCFNLDPCCTITTAKCREYYTKDDNGLSKSWAGKRVFMNPPYGREIGLWMQKAYTEKQNGADVVVCLVPARTDTAWWHDYAMKAKEIRYIRGRLKFNGHKNSAPFPSALVIY
jgi:phage N-6-adenine-methyltransferase